MPITDPPVRPVDARRSSSIDLLLALAVALVLSTSWAIADWDRLRRLILPDADDMMRLAQVRDWIGGQAMNDWTQYRMAPPAGAPMHWSRLNDIGLAGIILALTPLVGRHAAELIAVMAYPVTLLTASMLLTGRIATHLWGADARRVAIVLAGLAFPGTTLFVPGRIDHHALQVVTIQIAILALMRPTLRAGIVAGVALACSMMIGLETAPQVAALIAIASLAWGMRGATRAGQLAGFGGGFGGTTLLFLWTMRPTYWSAQLCDAFTPASATAILVVSGVLVLLAALTPRLTRIGATGRIVAGALLGGVALSLVLLRYPGCLTGPYGDVSPFLRTHFIAHIDEANSIFAQPLWWRAVSLCGLTVAACLVGLWLTVRQPGRWTIWGPVVAVVAVSALVTLSQVRGVYIGAPLAPPILAGLIVAARMRTRWRIPALMGAWIAAAGISYMVIPLSIERAIRPLPAIADPRLSSQTPQALCNSGDTWARVDRLPRGVVMAPTNMSSYMIGATHMSTVGAGYHRNDRANMDMYRYFLSPPGVGDPILTRWNVTYVMFCPGDFMEMDLPRTYPDSLAMRLMRGGTPPGFERVPLHGSWLRLYRIVR